MKTTVHIHIYIHTYTHTYIHVHQLSPLEQEYIDAQSKRASLIKQGEICLKNTKVSNLGIYIHVKSMHTCKI